MKTVLKDLALCAMVSLLVLCVIETNPREQLSYGLFWCVDHNLISDSDAEYIGEKYLQ